MKPAFKHVIAAAVLMLSFAAPVVAGPFEDAILSKSDTQAMFALSRSQWEANVGAHVVTGLGRAMGSPKTGIGLSTETPLGLLEVLPIYVDSDAKPKAVQIIVGYRPQAAALLSDASLQHTIALAKQEMLPEFLIRGDFKRFEGGLVIYFSILEARPTGLPEW
jgi:hypothetical protein